MNEREIQIPVGDGKCAVIRAEFPFSERQWKHLQAVLDAMKPGLVAGTQSDVSLEVTI